MTTLSILRSRHERRADRLLLVILPLLVIAAVLTLPARCAKAPAPVTAKP